MVGWEGLIMAFANSPGVNIPPVNSHDIIQFWAQLVVAGGCELVT